MKINTTTIAVVGAVGLGIAYFMNLGGLKDKVTGLLQGLKPGGAAPVDDTEVEAESNRARRYY